MNPASVLTLQAIRTVIDLMLETQTRDKNTARYDDLFIRLIDDIEALSAQERKMYGRAPDSHTTL